MSRRPKAQRTELSNREPPTTEYLERRGLRRISIMRQGDEDSREAMARVSASMPWASGATGTLHGKPYQCGPRWVFVYRPTEAPPLAVISA